MGSGSMLPRKIFEFCTSRIAGNALIHQDPAHLLLLRRIRKGFHDYNTSDGQNSRVTFQKQSANKSERNTRVSVRACTSKCVRT